MNVSKSHSKSATQSPISKTKNLRYYRQCHVENKNNYTIYNEKYFQKVSFCVITHLIGQNGRAVCKKHGNHGDAYARGAKRRALGAAGRPSIASSSTRVRVHTSTALGPTGPRPRLQYS